MTRRVLVTGGAHRLGALICTQFAQAGWEVWCHHARSADAAHVLRDRLNAQGLQVHTIAADLAIEAERGRLVQDIAKGAGPLHCVVNNASLFEPDTGLDFEPALARSQLEVNLIAPLTLARDLAQQMAAQPAPEDACVIHVLDQKVFNLNPDYFSYSISKLALERAVALQAQALAPHVRVCGVAPGLMFLSGPQAPENFERASRVNLLRRPIDPADVARTCLFLAQTPAITGSTVSVDNGQHLVPLERDVMFVVDELMKAPR